MRIGFLVLLSSLFTPLAYAHPGAHSADSATIVSHLLGEPDHLALLVLALIVGVVAVYRYRRRAAAHRMMHK